MTAARTGLLAGKQVRRLGLGTMRLTGPGIWGPPASEADAVQLLRKAVELGVHTSIPLTPMGQMWPRS